jgi:tRNA pseudouridine55 synthase
MATSEQFYMLQGQPVQIPGSPNDGVVRMYGESGSFLGIGEILDDGRVGPKRLIATN